MEFKDKAELVFQLFGCDTPEVSTEILKSVIRNDTEIYRKYGEITNNDPWFLQSMFQYYFADRDELKQDFTPESLSKLLTAITDHENEKVVYDICSGVGSLSYFKEDKKLILKDIDRNSVNIAVFVLAFMNKDATVICGDVLTDDIFTVYEITPGENSGTVEKINNIPDIEVDTVVSNPPFNLKEDKKLLNYAFVQKGLSKLKTNGYAGYILPRGVLSSTSEIEDRKKIIDKGYLQAVITVPGSMFENTSIPTCILLLSKKQNEKVTFINIESCDEKRAIHKRGTGKKCHENRVYKKEYGKLSDAQIEDVKNTIENHLDVASFSKTVPIQDIIDQEYFFAPGRYIDFAIEDEKQRSFDDIIDDINRCIADKNKFKITLNLTIAKELKTWIDHNKTQEKNNELIKELNEALDKAREREELFKQSNKIIDDINETLFFTDKKIENEKWLTITRAAKNEIRNTDPKELSETFIFNLRQCEMMITYLNNRENEYLAELRDKLLPLLMSGELRIPDDLIVPDEPVHEISETVNKESQKTLI